jgi:hypothetical protein
MLERMLIDTSTHQAWGVWKNDTRPAIRMTVDIRELHPNCAPSGYEREYVEEAHMLFTELAVEQHNVQ